MSPKHNNYKMLQIHVGGKIDKLLLNWKTEERRKKWKRQSIVLRNTTNHAYQFNYTLFTTRTIETVNKRFNQYNYQVL